MAGGLDMPVVVKGMFKNGWHPNCYKCGRFIGEGGYYDVVYDEWNGGWEEGYSECKKHFEERVKKEKKGRAT
jgi:hypothetical protein